MLAPRPNRTALQMALALSLVAHRKRRCCKKYRHALPSATEINVNKSGLYRSYFKLNGTSVHVALTS